MAQLRRMSGRQRVVVGGLALAVILVAILVPLLASSERRRRTNDPASGRLRRASRDGLWLAHVTRDQLGVAWSARPEAVVWQVVCWDSHDAAVGRLRLTGRHRRATFAHLTGLRQPFTIAVSGLGADGSVLWQRGLADLYLRADQPSGDERASDSTAGA